MLRIYAVDADPSPRAIAEVARMMRVGALALLPTETVYGIGVSVGAFADAATVGGAATPAVPGPFADPASTSPQIVNGAPVPSPQTGYGRIFTLKHRSLAQTVPWLVDGVEALDRYGVDVPAETRALAAAFWPGALTLVVKAAPDVPAFMQAADGTIALRASASPVIRALVRACGSPLAVTSANTHGMPAPTAFDDVEPRILRGVDVAVDAAATPCRDASTIVSCVDGRVDIVRQGALAAARIEEVLAGTSTGDAAEAPTSPHHL